MFIIIIQLWNKFSPVNSCHGCNFRGCLCLSQTITYTCRSELIIHFSSLIHNVMFYSTYQLYCAGGKERGSYINQYNTTNHMMLFVERKRLCCSHPRHNKPVTCHIFQATGAFRFRWRQRKDCLVLLLFRVGLSRKTFQRET